MSEASIRPIHAADWPALRALRLEALRTHPADLTADPAEAEARPDSFWQEWASRDGRDGRNLILLAFADDAPATPPAGMLGLYATANPKLAHAADLFGVYVRPAHRRLGLARRLLDAAIAFARGHGFLALKLGVRADNGPAVACYRAAGFTSYGLEPAATFVDGRYHDEMLMVLRLR